MDHLLPLLPAAGAPGGAGQHLLNRLPYTVAAIKEALCMFPPALVMRGGLPGVSLVDAHGNCHSTAGTNIWHGPCNCLGQTLALLDVKITLVLAAREFDVRHAYDEWDALHPAAGVEHVNGERAYQTMAGGGHPVDGYPCRVSVRA
ncbi:hypothetical protein B0T26DRAFT_871986 [Lasiosphaeria miniovina]|uniref:Uncharacterized protein n=1 Tax=Lasiosphaeria miniovina TaxID=1954250 RepID=A0AA40AKJ7_9PEZI|nr:uncharacterized protein B0T26DRAFT_871986 [Lasiosphaeria miniovina]KAK0717538.1 hypothetical protein B0T26DRAFT_871986 [Lasiosphaeria miniovina]